ncbi:transposase [Aquimarina longa]|uniref:transposase n=1 Tax=Aquimarina longa TaxID=1080221 RepID=UPI0005326115|nr:transposase [Aquimarina longa]
MKKRFYSKEFKSEAVRLSYQRENIKELADELGVKVDRIYRWRKLDSEDGVSKKASKPPSSQIDNQEVKELRKALKDAQLELEILKKAVHIFSKSDGKSINS